MMMMVMMSKTSRADQQSRPAEKTSRAEVSQPTGGSLLDQKGGHDDDDDDDDDDERSPSLHMTQDGLGKSPGPLSKPSSRRMGTGREFRVIPPLSICPNISLPTS